MISSPVFDQPWQAQIFALVVRLHEQGLFSWPEWSATLGQVLAEAQIAPQAPDRRGGTEMQDPRETSWHCLGAPDASWDHWPTALERLLVARAIAAPGALVALRQAWRLADDVTPHGQPVRLRAGYRLLGAGSGPDAGLA
jgi:nitrile hydratase accessory protein